MSAALKQLNKTINQHVPAINKVGRATIHSPIPDDLGADIVKATSILEHFIKGTNQVDSTMIPQKIIAKAKGIAVITMIKAGFVWTGRAGSGIVIAKLPDGRWSAPSAIAAAGAGFGAQIGGSVSDIVFLLMTDQAVKAFSHGGNVTLGGNLSVAAGPKGREAEAGGAILNMAPIYSYSKTKGLFAGLSIEGSVILARSGANKSLYGRKVSPKELLSGEVAPPVQAEALYRVLDLKFGNLGTGVAKPSLYTERTTLSRSASAPQKKSSKSSVGPMGASAATTLERPGAANAAEASTKRLPMPVPTGKADTAIALYDFLGERDTDLSFRKGDVITIISNGGADGWSVGRLNGKQGDFPGNYVQ